MAKKNPRKKLLDAAGAERDLNKELNKLLEGHNESLNDSLVLMQHKLNLGTKAQQQSAAEIKLAADLSKNKETQLALLKQMVDAEKAGNMAAYYRSQVMLEQITSETEVLQLRTDMAAKTKELTADLDAWQKKMKDIVVLGNEMATDWRVIGVVLGTAALKAGKEFKHWHKELQMSGAQAFTLGTNIASAGVSGLMMGVSIEATKKAATALVTEMGSLGSVTTQMIQDSAYISDNFGVSAENAAKLTRMFKGAEAATGRTSAETSKMVKDMATAANVPVGVVMTDMAENMEHFAKYSDGSVDNMAKMAIEAKKLGVSMGSIAKISDNLLDIESSMAAEMEASVLLGRQLDFSRARELAWAGKTAEAATEVLSQMGGIAGFNKMNVYQRQAAAAAAGLEVDELQKALQAEKSQNEHMEKYGNYWGDVISKATKYGSIAMDGATYAAENAHNIAAMGGALSNASKWIGKINILESIKNGILTARAGIMKLIGKGGGGGGVTPDATKDLKTKAVKQPAGKGLKDTAGGLKAMGNAKVLFGIANLALAAPVFVLSLAAIPFLTFMGLTPLAMLGPNLKGLAQGLTSMGKAAAGVLVMALAGPALALATLSLPFLLFMAIPGLGAAIQVNFALLAAGLAAFGNPATAVFVLIGIGLLAALGVAMIPFAFALSLVTPLVEAFGNIIIGVFSVMPPIIEAVGAAISNVIGAIGGFFTTLGSLDPLQILLLAPGLAALGLAGMSMLIGAPGFIAMAVGITALAGALTLLLPLMPMIETLASIGGLNVGGGAEGGAGGAAGGGDNIVATKLDELIDLTKKGKTIVMNGQKVGETSIALQRTYR